MKYLKIENHKGYFRIDGTEAWMELDQIDKTHLMKLLEIAASNDFEMDDYQDELLQNPAHNILYRNIQGKFRDFLSNRSRFKDSVDHIYKAAIEKYTVSGDGN